jgi:hypothetical protein
VSVRRAAADLLAMGKSWFPKERAAELEAVSTSLAISTSRSRPVLRWAHPDPLPPNAQAGGREPTRMAEDLARARLTLAECPDDVDSAEVVARSLGRKGDLAELRAAIGLLRKLDTGRFIAVLSEPEILARFAQPGLAEITAFLSIPQPALSRNQRPDRLPVHLLRNIHQTLFKQDPVIAASFRKLLCQQHWFPFLTEDLVRAGQPAAAVEWLAALLTAPPPEPCASSRLRFPTVSLAAPAEPAGPDLLLMDLEVSTIVEHHLTTPLMAALGDGNDPAHQLLIAYLKVLENPTVETYRQAFAPILSTRDAAGASALKKRFTDWLKRHKVTQPLAAAIVAEPPL